MVKVRRACDKPFWIYKRLDNAAATTAPYSDYVFVLEAEVLFCAVHAKEATKTSSLSDVVAPHLFNCLYIQRAYRLNLRPSRFNPAPRTL